MQQNTDTARFFDEKTSEGYDERARKIGAINDNIHLLIRIVLADLPQNARILCVGAGTGSEILALAKHFPQWRFTALDPSAPMLDICRKRVKEAGLETRCDFVHGYLHEVRGGAQYDAALCLLVTHFIQDDAARQAMFDDMHSRLKSGGYLITSDISYDTDAPDYADILEKWKQMHILSGASAEQAAHIPNTLREFVAVRSPDAIKAFFQKSGFATPVRFFQSLLIQAWYARKQ